MTRSIIDTYPDWANLSRAVTYSLLAIYLAGVLFAMGRTAYKLNRLLRSEEELIEED